jgi:uncharacterized protein YdeI (YjbR/CyaY-like superfamily)
VANTDPRVDAYIARSADFAKPILAHLRKVIHAACPEAEETIKWGKPTYLYGGSILCGIGAFKAHCVLGFWKGRAVLGDKHPDAKTAMGQFGRITTVGDLPSTAALGRYIKTAMRLNEPGARQVPSPMARVPGRKRPPLPVPADLRTALAGNTRARATFEGFSPTNRRDYIEWIVEAKAADTRRRRLDTAVEWLADGKTRHWKYAKR